MTPFERANGLAHPLGLIPDRYVRSGLYLDWRRRRRTPAAFACATRVADSLVRGPRVAKVGRSPNRLRQNATRANVAQRRVSLGFAIGTTCGLGEGHDPGLHGLG